MRGAAEVVRGDERGAVGDSRERAAVQEVAAIDPEDSRGCDTGPWTSSSTTPSPCRPSSSASWCSSPSRCWRLRPAAVAADAGGPGADRARGRSAHGPDGPARRPPPRCPSARRSSRARSSRCRAGWRCWGSGAHRGRGPEDPARRCATSRVTAEDRLAVVDVGSNSLRCSSARGSARRPRGRARGDGHRPAPRRRRGRQHRATPSAPRRDPGGIRRPRGVLRRRADGPGRTSAARRRPNRDEVAAVVETRLGAPMRLLSGLAEAASFAGARLAVDGDAEVLVVDVGGASTELVRGGSAGPDGAVSLQLGAVRQTERHRTTTRRCQRSSRRCARRRGASRSLSSTPTGSRCRPAVAAPRPRSPRSTWAPTTAIACTGTG